MTSFLTAGKLCMPQVPRIPDKSHVRTFFLPCKGVAQVTDRTPDNFDRVGV